MLISKGRIMTDSEKELVKKYPEAAAFAGVAESVWNGSSSAAKVEMEVKGRLHAELNRLLGKDIKIVFLTDSDIRHIKKKHGRSETGRGRLILPLTTSLLSPLF